MNFKTLPVFCLASVLFLCTKTGYAQDVPRNGYFFKPKIGILVRTGDNVPKRSAGNELALITGYYVNSRVGVGLGVGSSGYVNPTFTTFPVYADLQYFFKESRRSPFVFADAGYSFISDKHTDGGFLFNAGAGYALRMGRKSTVNPEIGFRHQGYGYKIGDNKRNENINSVSIGVSFTF